MKKIKNLLGILVFGMMIIGCTTLATMLTPPEGKGGTVIVKNVSEETWYWYVSYADDTATEHDFRNNRPVNVDILAAPPFAPSVEQYNSKWVDYKYTVHYRPMTPAERRDPSSASAAVTRENKGLWFVKTVNVANGDTFEITIP